MSVPAGWHQHANGGGLIQNTALVDETAQVSGNAQVSGYAWDTRPLYIAGVRHGLTNSRWGHLTIGCHEHTFEYWQEHYRAIGRAEEYTKEEIEQYGLFIQLFAKIGK